MSNQQHFSNCKIASYRDLNIQLYGNFNDNLIIIMMMSDRLRSTYIYNRHYDYHYDYAKWH